MSASRRIFDLVINRDPRAEQRLPDSVQQALPGNATRIIAASALQNSGDQTVNASTVLPWLFATLGVPVALVGLLVPIREAGSMLPQAFLTPWVQRVRHRKWVFVAGAFVQAAMAATMALIAALGEGTVAGLLILVALAVFALGRSLSSIASKDVLGRTVPKGERGQINGISTAAAGVAAITIGLVLRLVGGDNLSAGQLAWLLAGGAALWVLAAVVYARVREPAGEEAEGGAAPERADDRAAKANGFSTAVALLRDDAPFRHFVVVRGLLLVSALSPPFVVTLAVSSGTGALGGLGGFIIAAGLSSLIGGPTFGKFADRSSRLLMAVGAAVASAVLVLLLIVLQLPSFDGSSVAGGAVFVVTYFVLTLVHVGVRVGRKTYVVDMATGDLRTAYVAVSNSAMGVILLAAGAISALLSIWGIEWALVFLAALGAIGVLGAARLPEVSSS